jgi:plasmid maintenance system antidote protein VapI
MNRTLKARIIEKYGTQADFAQIMGIDETIVSRVVRNRRELAREKKQEWAKALDCNPQDVFQN